MNHTASTVISQLRYQIIARSQGAGVDQSEKVLNASLFCLGLLCDVMSFCLPTTEAEKEGALSQAMTSGASRTERWKTLLDEVLTWQKSRPQELQPLLEAEAREAAFPTILFAGGAGIYANVLYHTALFLLLSSRPRLLPPAAAAPHGEPAAHVSPLWHARRVCGIAMGSDPEHTRCWDPCMIAAFSLVARRMSHSSQQAEIVACLHRVRAAGWHVDGLVQRLRDEWGPTS